jgi:hypothetical protein
MIGAIFATIGLVATAGAAIFGFVSARNFMRKRLRFVDAAQGPAVPIIAGIVTCVLVSLLPFFGIGSGILVGLGVGGGVLAGKQDIVRGRLNP